MAVLDKEFNYYESNWKRLFAEYEGKFVVIKDEKIIGSFDNRMKAIRSTEKEHQQGTFLIQHIVKGKKILF